MSVSINLDASTGIQVRAERGEGSPVYVLVQQHDVLHHAHTIMSASPLRGVRNALTSTRHAVGGRSTLVLHVKHDRLGQWYDIPLKASQQLGPTTTRYEFAAIGNDDTPSLACIVSTMPRSRPKAWGEAG